MCMFCVSVLIVWNGVVERSFPVLCLMHSGIVGKLASAITFSLDSMMFSLCILWSDTCSFLSPRFLISLLLVIFHGDMGLGSPVPGMNVMLGIYSEYNEDLSVWLNVAYDCHKSYPRLRLYLDVNTWMT